MSGLAYAINGIPLEDDMTIVQLGSTFLSELSVARTVVNLPNRNGSVPTGGLPVFDERKITIKLFNHGQGFERRLRQLLRAFTMPTLTLSRMIDGVEQQASVQLVSLSPDGDERLGLFESYTVVLAMPGVFWKAKNEQSVILPLTGGVLTGLSCDAPLTGLVFQLPAKTTQFTASDPVSGTGVSWQGAASDGFTYVDSGRLQYWKSTSPLAFAPVKPSSVGVDYPSGGILQVSANAEGKYALTCGITGTTTGNITVRFKQQWW